MENEKNKYQAEVAKAEMNIPTHSMSEAAKITTLHPNSSVKGQEKSGLRKNVKVNTLKMAAFIVPDDPKSSKMPERKIPK